MAETAVGPVLVVVGHELLEEPAQRVLVPDQSSVQEFVADGANPALSEGVGPGGTVMTVAPTAANTSSKDLVYWPAPSRITNRIVLSKPMVRLRAA